MAEPLHNVSLSVQFVAHTTAEWAGSTPHYPPTRRPVVMKRCPDRGGVIVRRMEAPEPQDCPAANGSRGFGLKIFRTDSSHSAG